MTCSTLYHASNLTMEEENWTPLAIIPYYAPMMSVNPPMSTSLLMTRCVRLKSSNQFKSSPPLSGLYACFKSIQSECDLSSIISACGFAYICIRTAALTKQIFTTVCCKKYYVLLYIYNCELYSI